MTKTKRRKCHVKIHGGFEKGLKETNGALKKRLRGMRGGAMSAWGVE